MSRKSRHKSSQNLNYMSNRYTHNNPFDKFNREYSRISNESRNRNKYHPVRKAVRWLIYILHKLDDFMQERFWKWYR